MGLKFFSDDINDMKSAVFCFTGKAPKTRPEMEAIAINAGAQVTSNVNGRTTILVIADANSMSAKAQSARDRDIDLISPEQFFEICNPIGYGSQKEFAKIQIKKQLQIVENSIKKNRHSTIRRIRL